MNKKQLAAKIWESANQMRSKIEANEYKDYILGFIFYKYLSDKLLQFAQSKGMSEEEISSLVESDEEIVKYFKESLGYFIAYEDLFSTWVDAGQDFDVSNVRDALSAFNRLISSVHKKLFEGVFTTLETGLSKLGESAAKQTKAIRNLLHLIKAIPMDGKQDYDVLGFIYEYLISKFAANAGKKAGEFYTPHEVSLLMSEIIAEHLKDQEQIQIYDPTSGSGSLLINIGKSVAKHVDDESNIKYFAQELKSNTYNLTRMNLVMRGILPNNITTRNGDTLEDDWPYFEENDPIGTYNPLYVDAVVSNPPYSQKWDPADKETDPRYSRFGMAPKAKADYAFLLHDLYHLKPGGIMTIVLPHGVLFRGGEEGTIRRQLIELNHIDAVIGLPANVFFGTGIPTIIMVLRQQRSRSDVLIVDASKNFIKEGKNNKLRASDIKRITDAVINRSDIAKFSKVVSKKEIRDNEYNLNIPRYVDSSEDAESWDLHATMLGGIPENEINQLADYWKTFPGLRNDLFEKTSSQYAQLKVTDINQTITHHADVKAFVNQFSSALTGFDDYLKTELITKMDQVHIHRQESVLSGELFRRLQNIDLIDPYKAYQLLNDQWTKTAIDLEIIQTEGFDATKQVDPNMVIKKVKGKDTEVQDGWVGHVLPFELIQDTILKKEHNELKEKENRLSIIAAELEGILDSLTEEEKDLPILNDANSAFVKAEVNKTVKEIYQDVESKEINTLKAYFKLLNGKAKKLEKIEFIETHSEVTWQNITANKDGTYAKGNVNKYLQQLQSAHEFAQDSFEQKLILVSALQQEETELKKNIKEESAALHLQTKATIEGLSDQEILELLEMKWVNPLLKELMKMPGQLINQLTQKVQHLADKYATTYGDVEKAIAKTEKELSGLIDQLTGNECDMQGLSELKSFLQGE